MRAASTRQKAELLIVSVLLAAMRVLLALLSLVLTAQVSAQCEYAGHATLTMNVAAFQQTLVVNGAVIVRPQSEGANVEARVGLGFEGSSADVRYSLVNRVETGHGLVSLGPATRVIALKAHGSGLRFDTRINHYLELRALEATCDQMTLFRAPPVFANEFAYDLDGDGTYWTPRSLNLRLYVRPGGGGSYRLRITHRNAITLTRVEARGDWFRVAWTDRYNRLSGWVRRGDVRPSPLIGQGMTGGSGSGACARGRVHFTGDHIYRGPAQLRPGAFVRDAEGGEIWASVREADGFEVQHTNGSAWATIIVAPGVAEEGTCGELRHAWIRADEVTFPVPRRLGPEPLAED